MVFEVPALCANKILQDASRSALWLIRNDVLQVRVVGEEPIILSHPAASLADIGRPEKGNEKENAKPAYCDGN